MSQRLVSLLVDASSAVGTLRGIGETVPNPRLLIRPFIRREAVLSSRIEGTIASLSDVFAYEVEDQSPPGSDVAEVVNYVTALEYGIDQLDALPISYRLVNEIHSRLLDGVRGQDTLPGQFRDVQVWIGAPGSTIHDARFVPPPPNRLRDLFYDWEKFANESTQMPPLVRCALMHYQLEAIHPYPDGNGRIGRLLDYPLPLRERSPPHTPPVHERLLRTRPPEILRRAVRRQRNGRLGTMAHVLPHRRP